MEYGIFNMESLVWNIWDGIFNMEYLTCVQQEVDGRSCYISIWNDSKHTGNIVAA